jgi:hypothetical protein
VVRRTGRIPPPARRAHPWRLVVAAVAFIAAVPGEMRAQEASGYAELTAGRSDLQSEDSTGLETDTQSDSFLQRYGLEVNWRLYPNLTVLAGGLFERDAQSVSDDSGTLEATERKLHPYLNALLRTAIFSGQLGFYRNEDDVRAGGVSINNVQEIYNSTLAWRPQSLPSATFRFIRTNTIGADGRTQDTTDDLLDLVSEYQPADSVQIYYRGALENLEDRLQEIDIQRTTHSGRVTYGDVYWDRRLQVAAEYDVNYRQNDVTAGGGGEVVSPLFPIAGLSIISDTPQNVTLAPNPALIDEDRAASAGINLGLPPLGGDDRPRNIGLDFGGPTALNTLYVWVDRALPAPIADSFTWDVYTSADNLTWALRQTVTPATFGTFDTRFEIVFNEVSDRYVKVVSSPLARTVPGSDQFPDILVTELAAARRVPASEARGRTSLTTELLTTSLRARIADRPSLYYEMSYFARQTGALPTTYTLSNGLSLGHAFNPMCSVAGRVAREDSRETGGDRQSYLYSASLRAVPLPTLQHSIVLSGRSSQMDGRPSDSNSVYFYNAAELYRGVNANLGFGLANSTAEDGQKTETAQINALATLVPHRTTTLNLLYQSNDSTRRGGNLPLEQRLNTRARQAGVTYRPVSTLYFFFSYRRENDDRTGGRYLRNHSLSWSPFPDGSLQILLRYDETYRSDLDALSQIYSPRVRWNITDRWYAEVAYERAVFDSPLELSDRSTYTASTRIWF